VSQEIRYSRPLARSEDHLDKDTNDTGSRAGGVFRSAPRDSPLEEDQNSHITRGRG